MTTLTPDQIAEIEKRAKLIAIDCCTARPVRFARTDVPQLIATVRALVAENERLKSESHLLARTVLALLKHDRINNPSDYVEEMRVANRILSQPEAK